MAATRPRKKKRPRWRLLLISDTGRTRMAGSLRGWFYCGFVLLLAVAGALGYGSYQYYRLQRDNRNLDASLAAALQTQDQLRQEKEAFMVQLATVQSQLKNGRQPDAASSNAVASPQQESSAATTTDVVQAPQPTPKSVTIQVAQPQPSLSTGVAAMDASAAPAAPTKPAAPTASAATPASPSEPGAEAVVSVDSLELALTEDGGALEGQFRISNDKNDGQPLQGYIFVVLSGGRDAPTPLLTYPKAIVENGRPTQLRAGRYFSIYRFKTIRFSREFAADLDVAQIRQADILIYDKTGNLLLVTEFSVEL